MRPIYYTTAPENRPNRWLLFLSSLRKKKTRLIEALATHNEEHGIKTIICKRRSSNNMDGFTKDGRRKVEPKDGGRKRRTTFLPCISSQSSFIRSTSSKILPCSTPSLPSPLSSPSSSPSASSAYFDNEVRCASNTLSFAPIHTSEDTSCTSLYSPAFDPVATANVTSTTRYYNQARTLVPKDREQELKASKRVFSLVIPAKAEARGACSTRKPALAIQRKKVLVVKMCAEPYTEFVKSIAGMIHAENMDTLWEENELRQLLRSYLNLNAPRHHTHIKLAFAHVIRTMDTLLSSPQ